MYSEVVIMGNVNVMGAMLDGQGQSDHSAHGPRKRAEEVYTRKDDYELLPCLCLSMGSVYIFRGLIESEGILSRCLLGINIGIGILTRP